MRRKRVHEGPPPAVGGGEEVDENGQKIGNEVVEGSPPEEKEVEELVCDTEIGGRSRSSYSSAASNGLRLTVIPVQKNY